ncbi:MAG: CDP-alcohol phosphatidyltransferase family protein [Candidatus Hodarchaeales archaeon]
MSLQRLFARGKTNYEKGEEEAFKKEDITVRSMRKIANPLVSLVEPYSFITPNRLTWVGFALFPIAAFVLVISEDNLLLRFFAGFLCWIGYILDAMDGELARRRNIATKRGAWLDGALEELKGFPLFLAIGLVISDANGYFTVTIGSFSEQFDVWFVLFFLYGCLSFLSLGALHASMILDEPRAVSFGHLYFIWTLFILDVFISGLLELYLLLHTVGAFLALLYTLFEKTFLPQVAEGE